MCGPGYKAAQNFSTECLCSGIKMSLVWTFLLLGCLCGAGHGGEVCFDTLGCFSDLAPWGGTPQRPVSRLPWSPEAIGTRFLLFTQKNRYYQEIKPDPAILNASNYGGIRKTKFIFPGYLAKGEEEWPHDMCKAMIKWENVNCVAVEWTKGVKTQFAQAANNARVVAAQVSFMIDYVMGYYKQTAAKFHIIGHGLGAHAAGEVGSKIPGLARITGLDPVEPYFHGCDTSVRLDTTDATFVDVIHTDALPFDSELGLGMSQAVGHIDFYPNGGELMPGCSKNSGKPSDLDAFWEGTKPFQACSHTASYQYYSESILKPNGFLAYPCPDIKSFEQGYCFPCAAGNCPLMGHDADKFVVTEGISQTKYFLTTGSSKPFGRYTYRVKLTLGGPVWTNPGSMFVALFGNKDNTVEFKIHKGTLSPGSMYDVMVNAETDVGEVTEMNFRWNNIIWNPLKPKYGASRIEVQRGKDKKIFYFCGTENVAENTIQSVLPCQAWA